MIGRVPKRTQTLSANARAKSRSGEDQPLQPALLGRETDTVATNEKPVACIESVRLQIVN